jgi:hypothetical protein
VFDFASRNSSRSRQAAIRSAPFLGGSSFSSQAFSFARELLVNEHHGYSGGNVVVIYATNDVTQDTPEDLEGQVDLLRSIPGVEIYALAIGDQVSLPELRSIVTSPPSHYILQVAGVKDLTASFAFGSLSFMCVPPPITTTTTTTTPFSCASTDFIFLIGASATSNVSHWQSMLKFYADIVDLVADRSRFV